jgi:hypothetical protein
MLTLAQASAWNFGGNRKLFLSSIENKKEVGGNLNLRGNRKIVYIETSMKVKLGFPP